MPLHSGWGACHGASGGFDGVYELTLLRTNGKGFPPSRNNFIFEIAGDTVEAKSSESQIGITWSDATTCYLQTASLVKFADARDGLGVLLTPPGQSFSVRQHFIVVKREDETIVVKRDTSGEELSIGKDWWLQGAFPEMQLQKPDSTRNAARNPFVIGRHIDGDCYMSNPNPFVNGDTCSHTEHVQLRFDSSGKIEAYVRQDMRWGSVEFCCPREVRYIGPPTATTIITLEAFRDDEKAVVRCINLAGSVVASIPIDETRTSLAEFRDTLAKQLETSSETLRILLPEGSLMDSGDELMYKLLSLNVG